MAENNQITSESEKIEQQLNLKQIIAKYLIYWPWFGVTLLVALILAFVYVRYTPNIYTAEAKINILDSKSDNINLPGLGGDGDNPIGSLYSSINLQNKIELLKSRRLLDSVVTNLELTTSYFLKGNIKNTEKWENDLPFKISWIDTGDSLSFNFNLSLKYDYFVIKNDENSFKHQGKFGDTIAFYDSKFIVQSNLKNRLNPVNLGDNYLIKYNSESRIIDKLLKKLTIGPTEKGSEVLLLSIKGENKSKNEAILNEIIKQFNRDGINDKQISSKRLAQFVQDRLKIITKELDTIETRLVNFKSSEGIFSSIEISSQQLYTKEYGADQSFFELEMQKSISKAFKDELKKSEKYSLLPSNLNINNNNINDLTQKYNDLVIERNSALTSSTSSNPNIIHIEAKLDRLRENVLKTVDNYLKSLEISIKGYLDRENLSTDKLSGMPQTEKNMRSIIRQRDIKENLYLFLLQKQEEANIRYAIASDPAKVIDYAYSNDSITNKNIIIYMAAVIIGLLLPFGILYIIFLFDTKIHNTSILKSSLPDVPILAEIPELDKKDKHIIRYNDISILAEAFRILRTNLNFVITKNDKTQGKVIYVTSSIKSEGKTFISINTANTLASTGKKTLIIGTDLRNPQTHNYYNLDKNDIGVSAYLVDNDISFDDLINPINNDFDNLDLILAGEIPPNPAEILLRDRFEELINEAKKRYDYVIIDTAPTGLVTDTFLISKYADITIYAVRAGVTDIKLLTHIEDIYKNHKLNNISIVLNGISNKRGYSYNYGYGYGYSQDSLSSWWKFWKKK